MLENCEFSAGKFKYPGLFGQDLEVPSGSFYLSPISGEEDQKVHFYRR